MKSYNHKAPVITLDGPGGVGKGTISQKLSTCLSWHYLNSGALYRVLAIFAKKHAVSFDQPQGIADLVKQMNVRFTFDQTDSTEHIFLENDEITHLIYQEATGMKASILAASTDVRTALFERQRNFRKHPGLVTDGRDMGTTIFPDAVLKFYLTASVEERARRRYLQLLNRGEDVILSAIEREIIRRDVRDRERLASPLRKAADAIVVDTTNLSIDAAFAKVWNYVQQII